MPKNSVFVAKLCCLFLLLFDTAFSADSILASGEADADKKSDDTQVIAKKVIKTDDVQSQPIESHELSSTIGKGVFYPVLNLSLGYRSDVYENDGNVRGAPLLSWRVGAGYQGENRGHLNGVEYLIEGNEFLSGDNNEDEISQRATAYWGTAFTPRHHLDLGLERIDAYDPRGEEISLRNIRHNTSGAEPDEWKEKSGGGIYNFGSDEARGRIELSAFLTNREYDNNQQQYRDRDELDLSAAAYLKVMPKTQVFAQVVHTDIDYVDQLLTDPSAGRDLDSEEMRYMIGTKWQPSKKLSGVFRVGTAEKTFVTSSGRADYDELSWDSNIRWSPNYRNNFGINYSRSPRETFVYDSSQALDNFIEVEQLDVSWSHLWGHRFTSNIGLFKGDDNYQPSGRSDDREGFSVGLSLALRRWGTIGINYYQRETKSSFPEHNFDEYGVVIFFNIGAALGLGDGNHRAPGIRSQRSYRPGYAVY